MWPDLAKEFFLQHEAKTPHGSSLDLSMLATYSKYYNKEHATDRGRAKPGCRQSVLSQALGDSLTLPFTYLFAPASHSFSNFFFMK